MIKAVFFVVIITMISCSSSKKVAANDLEINLTDEDKNGIGLIEKGDCFTCHSINDKLIGPSFTLISKKYRATESNLEMLSKKIMTGGSGHWGKIPMTPHSSVSKDEAESIVKYIFTLKN
ncbi:MAG TPA: c-type cytochrome [Chitinophagaceae bacterium]|jgi:cytochrome c|nr:c-type cytochrome [Chitinophagaceae bacterium]